MIERKLHGPVGTKQHYRYDENAPEVRRIDAALKAAAAKSMDSKPLMICDPQGSEEKKLHNNLLTFEAGLNVFAATIDGYGIITGMIDKSRQNPINKLGDSKAAGERAMEAYWHVADSAVKLVAGINGSDNLSLRLIRVSPSSDEGIFVIGGRDLTPQTEIQFDRAWKMARKQINLRDYKYTLEVPYKGQNLAYELDLEAFSRVLRHNDMVVSCNFSISKPVLIDPLRMEGYIMEEIRKLENREIEFYSRLPKSFTGNNGGLAEVITPFDTSLSKLAEMEKDPQKKRRLQEMDRGSFVEIKLKVPSKEALSLLPFTEDHDEYAGTRKGFAEIFSGLFGMRGFNTFTGKARANAILTPIAQAMGDLDRTVIPVSGGYLTYWLDMTPTQATAESVKKAIMRRVRSKSTDHTYIDLDFEPVVNLVDASSVKVPDVRARMILKALGKDLYPVATLDMADFILNFIENVHPAVQQGIYDSLALYRNGGRPVRASDLDNMSLLRRICATRRTIRDTEDFIWTLREDEMLPGEAKTKKKALEEWFFDFSVERFEIIFKLLAERIALEIKNRA